MNTRSWGSPFNTHSKLCKQDKYLSHMPSLWNICTKHIIMWRIALYECFFYGFDFSRSIWPIWNPQFKLEPRSEERNKYLCYIIWVKMNNTVKRPFLRPFLAIFCQLYGYLSQKWGSDGRFEVLNRSTSWLVQTLWPQM